MRVSQRAEIHDSNSCPSDRNTFLSNYANKEMFVRALAENLQSYGFTVVQCPSDADTTLAKVALGYPHDLPVTVYSDDTDVLCLLIHHVLCRNNTPDISVTNMTRKNNRSTCTV